MNERLDRKVMRDSSSKINTTNKFMQFFNFNIPSFNTFSIFKIRFFQTRHICYFPYNFLPESLKHVQGVKMLRYEFVQVLAQVLDRPILLICL